MPDYIEELNEGQRNAVLYNDGPSLVIAGAGSGKITDDNHLVQVVGIVLQHKVDL